MRLSTSTNLFCMDETRSTYLSLCESIQWCYDAGFRVLDANLCGAIAAPDRRHPLALEDWQWRVAEARDMAERLGVVFTQSHLPFESAFFQHGNTVSEEYKAFFMRMVMRAIEASAMLGVSWAVVHPWTDTLAQEHDLDTNLKTNLAYFTPIIAHAKRHRVGIAMENMLQAGAIAYRFAARADELAACIDQFGDDAVGACWDYGHGNIVYRDQSHPVRLLGKRLKALHVDDNKGDRDAHLLPYAGGNIDWPTQMRTLREIGYTGDFTYEVHGFTQRLPEALWPIAGRMTYEMGMYLLSLAG